MIRLQIISGKMAGQSITARRFPFRIGRGPESDLRSEDAGVWEQHCQIDYRPLEGFFVTTQPRASTLLGTEPLTGPTRLVNGSELVAGSLRLRFALDDPPARSFRLRNTLTWLALLALVLLQAWLISYLPK